MNQEQYEHAFEVLRNDCRVTGMFQNSDGDTCAIGALLDDMARQFLSNYDGMVSRISTLELASRLGTDTVILSNLVRRYYGIDIEDIIAANDHHSDLHERRLAVLRAFNKEAAKQGILTKIVRAAEVPATW